MKKIRWSLYSVILVSFLSFSCTKGKTPQTTNEMPPTGTNLFSGTFKSSTHPTSGMVKVIEDTQGKRHLAIENFSTDNGPDLRVWLSPDNSGSPYVEAGILKAINGSFSYELSDGTDLTLYNRVLIWCEDFSVLFGYAILQ